jgi:PAS domain S-box-containing protein
MPQETTPHTTAPLVHEPWTRAMLDAALDCVVAMDHLGRVAMWNRAAERTFGYTAEEAMGQDMADLIVPPALRPAHRAGLQRMLDGGDAVVLDRRIEITGIRADGTILPVELTITRIDLPGDPVFVGYVRDITERALHEAELHASRRRILAAADEARERIERDLHDGAQQALVGLALTLRLAQARLSSSPEDAAELLDEALDQLAAATHELRELARGIHPAVLTEGGLGPAIDSLVARCPVPVRVEGVPARRLSAPVEATAYFVISEALTNVARYAGAERAWVSLVLADTALTVVVGDDGRGGAHTNAGSGLRGLGDRVAALGGALTVTSPHGEGTTVEAVIPCGS